jgi:hypothetical protein
MQKRLTFNSCLVAVALVMAAQSSLQAQPTFTKQPSPAVQPLQVGGTITWSVAATSSSGSLTYHWYQGTISNPIVGATNPSYTLTNVTTSLSGVPYFCVATDSGGSTPSSSVSVSVLTATSPYVSTVMGDHPIAFFRLDEGPDNGKGDTNGVAYDTASGQNGVYTNVILQVPGYSSFDSDDVAAAFGQYPKVYSTPCSVTQTNANAISFASAAATNFSVEAWVRITNSVSAAGIVHKGGGSITTEQFALDTGASGNGFRFYYYQNYALEQSGGIACDSGTAPALNTWYHVVGVLSQTTSHMYLYTNGVLAGSYTTDNGGLYPTSLNVNPSASSLQIGMENTAQFEGTIANVALYNYALSATQVANHYAATLPVQIIQLTSSQLWQRQEFQILNVVTTGNPFDPDSIHLDVAFTLPSGRIVTVPAFWYQGYQRELLSSGYESLTPSGSPQWRARFTPPEVGTYSLALTIRTNGQVSGSPVTAGFTVPAGASPPGSGYVGVAAGNRYLQTSDGQALRLVGHDVCWFDAGGTYDYDVWFAAMAAAGENYTRVWMCEWAFGIENTPASLTNYALPPAWQLDYVLQLAEQLGIRVELCLDQGTTFQPGPGSGQASGPDYWPSDPYNVTNGGPCLNQDAFFTNATAQVIYQKRLRYLIGRYGYSPNLAAWQLLNEIDNGAVSPYLNLSHVAAWHGVMGGWLHTNDPFGHLVTTSLTSGSIRSNFWSIPTLDIATYHSYADWDSYGTTGPAVRLSAVAQSMLQSYGKPVLIDEFGTSSLGWNSTGDPYLRGFRQGVWGGALGGSVGTAMSWWWENIQSGDVYPLYTVLEAILGWTDWGQGLWTNVSFQTSKSSPVAIGLAGARESLLYVVAPSAAWPAGATNASLPLQTGQSVTLANWPGGSYDVAWYAPATGAYVGRTQAATSNNSLNLPLPAFSEDLAGIVGLSNAPIWGPTITTQPQSQTVNPGANVTFSVTAAGVAPLAYQWRFNAANLSGATASSYTATNVQTNSAGSYSVVVTNPMGSLTSAPALLALSLPPTITNQPQSQTVVAGQGVSFSVGASGATPLSYQWWWNGANLPGATASAFTLAAAWTTNGGWYWVVVTNALGATVSSEALLAVLEIEAWGDNSLDQLDVSPEATNVIALAAGAWHSLALRADGAVLAWGDDTNGQCDVPLTLQPALAIAGGGYHSLALQADGTVAAWGAGDYGQTNVPPGLANVIGIGAGTWHSLALRRDGTVAAWGDNSWGQTNLPVGLSNVVAIAAWGNHSLALQSNGLVAAWGENTDADGNFVGESIVPTNLTNVVAIAAGEYHSLAVRADGTVSAWGDDSQGQCDVPVGLSNVVALAGGGAHSLALKTDGTVAAWGVNWDGQCSLPSGLSNVVGIGAGEDHSLALLAGSIPVPRLLSPAWQSGRFSLLAQTLNRKSYALECKTSTLAANWSALSTNTGNGALEQLSDPAATASQRFYRMRQW